MQATDEKQNTLPPPLHEREMPITDHLTELRVRLIRSLVMVAVASVFVWFYFNPLYAFFTAPIKDKLPKDAGLVVTNWLEPFFIHLKISLYGGLVASAPFWLMELWGFVAPALTPEERKPIRILAPATVVLFLLGVALAHMVLPATFGWALSYMPPNAQLLQSVNQYVEFLAKMYLAFGLAFQLPVVLVFLARVGLIDAPVMRQYWRHAIIVIMLLAAVITPSGDPVTMSICAAPMALLYMLSILLVERMAKSDA